MSEARRSARVIAHRGGDVGKANSLGAIRSAAERGADGVEIDIQLADGRLIARHDLGDMGDESFDGLEAVLALTAELDVFLLIDFKSAGPHAVDAEVEALASMLPEVTAAPKLAVSAFSLDFLEHFGRRRPEIERHAIVSLRQNFWGRTDIDFARGTSVLAAALVVNPLLALRTKRAGGRLLVWFGATEWPWLVSLVRRLGADALIVKRLTAAG